MYAAQPIASAAHSSHSQERRQVPLVPVAPASVRVAAAALPAAVPSGPSAAAAARLVFARSPRFVDSRLFAVACLRSGVLLLPLRRRFQLLPIRGHVALR